MSDTGNSDRLLREAMQYKQRAREFKARAEALAAERDRLTRERDDALAARQQAEAQFSEFKAKAEASPSELERQVNALKGELRLRDHRSAFERAAAGKLRPDALEAAWKLSGYTPESDDVDEGQITGLVEQLAKANPFLAQAPGEGQGDPAAKAATARTAPVNGVRGGQGAPAAAGGVPVITRDQLRDPGFTSANREMLANGHYSLAD